MEIDVLNRSEKMRSEKNKNRKTILLGILVIIAISAGLGLWYVITKKTYPKEKPEDLIVKYMNHIKKREYEDMYSMVIGNDGIELDKKGYIARNSKIYEGIGMKDMRLKNIKVGKEEKKEVIVSYDSSFHTVAGEIKFHNTATFVDTKDGYKILWGDSLIFPDLEETDRVSVSTLHAERGKILDRNGRVLAGKGVDSSVGIVPGRFKNEKGTLHKLAKLLDIDAATIKKKLEANWVKDDSYVPIATIPKIKGSDLIKVKPKQEVLQEQEHQKKILSIPGVMLSDVKVRSYEMGKAASHLIGYVQKVTAEDLQDHPKEGYGSDSVIGKSGVEGLFEKELKGQEGHEISIVNKDGKTREILASTMERDGEDIRLTIDSKIQTALYERFKKDRGCSVAINPYTGEVLALVSTPSYDNNDFIKGMSAKEWTSLNKDSNKPLYNRFRQIWCPGSTFKPMIAAIGLKTGKIDPNKNDGTEIHSWQKGASWGSYYVTTLHTYQPVIMKNAIIYSDNIYFAKAALKIGAANLMKSLDELGFGKKLPFEIMMTKSQYSNTKKIESEIQLADSGYGQGQVLVNPLHLASLYTAFLNEGNILKPYLRYQEEPKKDIWISKAFSADTIHQVMEGLKGVVNNPHGTGYAAHRGDITLAGKTGTAEIKATKGDAHGTEIGWFSVFTTKQNAKKPILIVSMVENVKGKGGSAYVVHKDKAVLDDYLK